MQRVFVKICGFTRVDEAVSAAFCGVNAIGLVFAEKSPRRVDFRQAAAIVRALPLFVQSVGVFVNNDISMVKAAVDTARIDMLQLHGDESPDYCRHFEGRVIKAFRVRSVNDIEAMMQYEEVVRGFLLDAWSPDAEGGTGMQFDWSIALEAVRRLSRPVILAGGLAPENVGMAVRQVDPWGVDASSGVEISPGRKDLNRIQSFVNEVRNTECHI